MRRFLRIENADILNPLEKIILILPLPAFSPNAPQMLAAPTPSKATPQTTVLPRNRPDSSGRPALRSGYKAEVRQRHLAECKTQIVAVLLRLSSHCLSHCRQQIHPLPFIPRYGMGIAPCTSFVAPVSRGDKPLHVSAGLPEPRCESVSEAMEVQPRQPVRRLAPAAFRAPWASDSKVGEFRPHELVNQMSAVMQPEQAVSVVAFQKGGKPDLKIGMESDVHVGLALL